MVVTQVADIVNEAIKQVTGVDAVLEQDLTNVVEVGKSIMNANSLDNFVRQLPDVLGRVYFTNTKYEGINVPIVKDAWEFGAAYARITAEMPTAVTNEVWDLQDGQSYDPNIFHKPSIKANYWQERNAFDVQISIAKDQVKSAFQNASQLNSFISCLMLEVENAITTSLDGLALSTIDTLIADTVADEFSTGKYDEGSGIRAVNLFYGFKQENPTTTLTAKTCLNDEKFLEYACEVIGNYTTKLTKISTLFNMNGLKKFTPKERLTILMLDQFKTKTDVYLKSSRFHDELVSFPKATTLPYWQGTGTDFGFEACSKINVVHGDTNVELSGILCTMLDDRAAMICNQDQEVDSIFNPCGRFFNYFYHIFNGLLIDKDFNCVVFFVA